MIFTAKKIFTEKQALFQSLFFFVENTPGQYIFFVLSGPKETEILLCNAKSFNNFA